MHYPEEFGGQGLGLLECLLAIEAFCRADSGIGSALATADLGSEAILKFGSLQQKRNFLPPLARAEKMLGIAFAESEDDRDFTSISAFSERAGEEYFLRGRKRFVLNASRADAFVTLCKDPGGGWMTLIVGGQKDGVEIQPIDKMGLRMTPFGDLTFKEVRVPLANVVGREGEGMVHVTHCHQAIGLRSAAQALGTAHGAFDRAVQHAKQREQFGKKLSQFEAIRHKLADMAAAIEVARWLTYKAATEYDQGKMEACFLSIAQLEVGRILVKVVDEALQIMGGYGYMAEEAIEHYFRDAWAIGVQLGTEEELKNRIAETILT